MAATATRTRMTKEARRDQLLDMAERILIEKGSAALTMERLAEYADVSKSLPYSHFDNSDEVLVAVYQRVVFELGGRVLRVLDGAAAGDDKVALVVKTYFDTVRELGPILSVVTAPGSRSAELADGDRRLGPQFLSEQLERHFDLESGRARAVAPILLSALTGAVEAWKSGDADRAEVESISVDLMRCLTA